MNKQWSSRVLVALLMVFLMALSSLVVADEGRVSLELAFDRLDSAIDLSAGSGEELSHVLEAAAELSYVMNRDGIESATGHLALGNAYFIGNDLGRAILHYRQGLMIDPDNPTLLANLAHARSFVEPTMPGEMEGDVSVASVLLLWKRVVDRWTLWYISIGLLCVASVMLTVRMRKMAKVPLMTGVWVGFAGLVGLGLLGFEQWTVAQDRSVVVVSIGTGMYSGPGVGVYQEVYDGPLGVGTEGVALESRDGWTNIEFGNDQGGWVMSDSLVYVRDGSGG